MEKYEDMYLYGLLLGIAIYILFFSKSIVKISVKLITFLKKIIYSIVKILVFPFKKVFIRIYRLISNTTNNLKKTQNKVKNSKKLEKKEGF